MCLDNWAESVSLEEYLGIANLIYEKLVAKRAQALAASQAHRRSPGPASGASSGVVPSKSWGRDAVNLNRRPRAASPKPSAESWGAVDSVGPKSPQRDVVRWASSHKAQGDAYEYLNGGADSPYVENRGYASECQCQCA